MKLPRPELPSSVSDSRSPAETGSADGDALEHIAGLRDALKMLGSPAEGVAGRELAKAVSDSLDRIMVEHSGMADELIAVYEQLGIIFEVTRKLPTVAGESEVIGLFVESLRRSFARHDVMLIRPAAAKPAEVNGQQRAWRCDCGGPPDPRILSEIDSACSANPPRVVVRVIRAADAGRTKPAAPDMDILIGPVFSGKTLICVLVIRRSVRANDTGDAPEFRASDMQLVDALTTFCGDVIRNHRLAEEMRDMSIAMVRSLVSAVDQKDEYTCGHSLRVGYYATTLGRLLGLANDELQMLQWGALLHDVGKIGIRDDVLKKQGKLTVEEFDHIKEHPTRSYSVVEQVPQLAAALDGILHHHERYDGSGYPSGLKGESIPLHARIIQIADVFDALTSSRSYRPAYDWQKALAILEEESGKTVDPRLHRIFDQYIRARLGADPAAWEAMVAQANQFASSLSSDLEVGPATDGPGETEKTAVSMT